MHSEILSASFGDDANTLKEVKMPQSNKESKHTQEIDLAVIESQLAKAQLAIKQLFIELDPKSGCCDWGIVNNGLIELNKAEESIKAINKVTGSN